MQRFFLLFCLCLAIFGISCNHHIAPQTNINIHSQSVDSLLVWMDNACSSSAISQLENQPAMQFARQIWQANNDTITQLSTILQQFDPHDSLAETALHQTYQNRTSIRELLNALKAADFSADLNLRVANFFPATFSPGTNYDIFLTAIGWEWGDATAFNYTQENGKYLIAESGSPAILLNLSIIDQKYGETVEEKMDNLTNVVSHEMFHAFLLDFPKTHWKSDSCDELTTKALYKLLNEGLAHYVADGDFIRAAYVSETDSEWLREDERKAFANFSDSMAVVVNPQLPELRRQNALAAGLHGGYWSKYVCITGLFMAYHIDNQCGMEELRRCVEFGPCYFVEKYRQLMLSDESLPKLNIPLQPFAKKVL